MNDALAFRRTLAQRLSYLRQRASQSAGQRITQEEVGAACGVSRAHLAGVETARTSISLESAARLAHFYGVTLDYLMGREPHPPLVHIQGLGRGDFTFGRASFPPPSRAGEVFTQMPPSHDNVLNDSQQPLFKAGHEADNFKDPFPLNTDEVRLVRVWRRLAAGDKAKLMPVMVKMAEAQDRSTEPGQGLAKRWPTNSGDGDTY
ncbi:helix-turn-helix transcriptional regulator [Formicincola oecophyllae]|uniref:Helix-turn-helix transcriptional regulator n=1 Tax=Formicincola oecophyllae TaxID=2558361 RepID=A0A4Y6U8H0_9PROT|nr:helix-turn-helix transcriptional regulator [Formicincola oecophyllae]QDH13280.1 helix-turn-helix transcriptional regulator [Formicincola oecophyllae]